MLSYLVKRGDTMQRIAACHRVSIIDLTAVNDPQPGGNPRAGQVLNIPASPFAKAVEVLPAVLKMINAALTALQNPGAAEDLTVDHHFRLAKNPTVTAANLRFITGTYRQMVAAFANPRASFREVNNDTATAEALLPMNNPGALAGAYSLLGRPIAFVSHYASLGPNARAAVMIHEGAHTVSGLRIGHGQGESGPAYVNETPASAILNAHCYANFAAAIGPATLAWDGTGDFGAAWGNTMFDASRPWGLARPND